MRPVTPREQKDRAKSQERTERFWPAAAACGASGCTASTYLRRRASSERSVGDTRLTASLLKIKRSTNPENPF